MRKRRQPTLTDSRSLPSKEDIRNLKEDKRARLVYFQNKVDLGKNAELVLQYLDGFLDLVEDNTLKDLKEGSKDANEVKMFYNAAIAFHDYMSKIVKSGQENAIRTDRLRLEIAKENKRSE